MSEQIKKFETKHYPSLNETNITVECTPITAAKIIAFVAQLNTEIITNQSNQEQ